MRPRHVFCNRRNGVTIKARPPTTKEDRFIPHPTTSDILAKELERKMNKQEVRIKKQRKQARI